MKKQILLERTLHHHIPQQCGDHVTSPSPSVLFPSLEWFALPFSCPAFHLDSFHCENGSMKRHLTQILDFVTLWQYLWNSSLMHGQACLSMSLPLCSFELSFAFMSFCGQVFPHGGAVISYFKSLHKILHTGALKHDTKTHTHLLTYITFDP